MQQAIIGIDLGGTNIKSVLLDARTNRVITRLQTATQAGSGVKAVITNIVSAIGQQQAVAKKQQRLVQAIGIGSAGLVNNGIVRNSPNLPGWQGAVPLLRLLKTAIKGSKIPLALDNDVNAFVIAEQRLGAARGHGNVIGLTLGTGVGGGIIIDGRLYRGTSGGAGELGHASIIADGPRCLCGNQGCLEALVGARAIAARYNDLGFRAHGRIDRSITVEAIAALARKKDTTARQTLAETGRLLGVALANLVNIFNPDVIVIGGGVAQAGDLIIAPAGREMRRRAMPASARHISIRPAKLGPWAGAIGAALLAADRPRRSGPATRT
jgi:glucokinase